MSPAPRPRHPVLLIVIDGWGVAPDAPDNAVARSGAPVMNRLAKAFPSAILSASGVAVGLPSGQMGNSEVGHLTIGAGRIIDQDFVRISKATRDGRLGRVPALRDLFAYCVGRRRPLHLLGLLGPGGVHSHQDHLYGLLEAAVKAGVPRVWVHHVLDGRDTPPKSAPSFAEDAQARIDQSENARVATVSGRYWTMDRDKRWDRTQRAYRLFTRLEGHASPTVTEALDAAYARGETDEFVAPTVVGRPDPLRDGDALLIYNFRPDRARQIVRALADPAFQEFPTEPVHPRIVTMTLYDRAFDALGVQIAFPPDHPPMTLGEYYASLGLRQLRIAETEKYAHVTYFFSGGREPPFPGEERILVASPKVATYDLQPSMSAREVTEALLQRLASDTFDLIVLNFANPDMVGHSGRLEPTVEACRVVDECIGRIVEAAHAKGYVVAVTADHGNAESMVDEAGQPRTAHTTNPVPFILAHPEFRGGRLRPGGGLSNVAATLLEAVGLPVPPEISGSALVAAKNAFK